MCVQAGGAKEHAAQFKKTLLHGEPLYISTDELDPKYIEDFKKALPDHEVRKPALPNHTVKAYQSQFVVHLLPCVAVVRRPSRPSPVRICLLCWSAAVAVG